MNTTLNIETVITMTSLARTLELAAAQMTIAEMIQEELQRGEVLVFDSETRETMKGDLR